MAGVKALVLLVLAFGTFPAQIDGTRCNKCSDKLGSDCDTGEKLDDGNCDTTDACSIMRKKGQIIRGCFNGDTTGGYSSSIMNDFKNCLSTKVSYRDCWHDYNTYTQDVEECEKSSGFKVKTKVKSDSNDKEFRCCYCSSFTCNSKSFDYVEEEDKKGTLLGGDAVTYIIIGIGVYVGICFILSLILTILSFISDRKSADKHISGLPLNPSRMPVNPPPPPKPTASTT